MLRVYQVKVLARELLHSSHNRLSQLARTVRACSRELCYLSKLPKKDAESEVAGGAGGL